MPRLDLWKRLCNFLGDYSDGFTQYQSEQMWGLEIALHRWREMFLKHVVKQPTRNKGDVNVFNHASPLVFESLSELPPLIFSQVFFFLLFYLKNILVKIMLFQLYKTRSYNDFKKKKQLNSSRLR